MEDLETKVGKRIRGDKVSLIQEIIDALQMLLGWAIYEDKEKAANWNARVGESIIGNLARGKGGRFISASNINSMMNQLDKENISPDMFEAMQDLLAGKEVDAEVLDMLKAAGLATEDGNATTKASEIIVAMKTGDPDKLKGVLNPKGGGKGKGKKPPKAPKPSKDEIEENNIHNTGMSLVELGRMTEQQVTALKRFANGLDVDDSLMQELLEMGIVIVNDDGYFAFTTGGKQLITAMGKADLRASLDALTKAKPKKEEETPEEEQKNFEDDFNLSCGFKMLQYGYLLTWTTNAYEDREGETFTLKSIKEYVARNVDNENKGTYQFWHIPGSDFADIIWQGVVGKFLVEIGKFREDEIGKAFKAFFNEYPNGHPEIAPLGWGDSHGFVYKKQDRADGIYEWFDKKETTVLPLQEAANIYTLAEFLIGEKAMDLSDKQINALNKIGAEVDMPSLLEKILSVGKKRTEALDGSGVASKQAVMKTEGGEEYPAKCYAYVPDAEKVDTWKLRMCAVGTTEITREQLGAAASAFSPGGHRGEKVQLPSEDVDKVKAKLRSEYNKLGVSREEMPASIKSLEVEVKELQDKFALAIKACSTDLREKMDAVLNDMEKAESDTAALVRQLAELAAQVTDEELRTQLEEVVGAMSELLANETEQPAEEIATEEEMPVEDEAKEAESKELDIEKIAEALKLNELSVLLEEHNKAISENANALKAVSDLVNAVEELVNKNKELFDKVGKLEEQVNAVGEKTADLERDDEEKLAEKQARFVPFWGNKFQASKAAETVLDGDKADKIKGPEVPNVITAMSSRIRGVK